MKPDPNPNRAHDEHNHTDLDKQVCLILAAAPADVSEFDAQLALF